MTSTSSWLLRPRPNPRAGTRLVCFPYAGGGGTVFSSWATLLPSAIELCAVVPPGRGLRLAEPPFVDPEPYLEALASAIEPEIDRPVAFFGHSLGALIAFELIRLLRDRAKPLPIHLFASGHVAPSVPGDGCVMHTLDDRELIEEVRKFNGTPPVLLENRELMELMLPTLRADLAVSERYRYVPAAPIPCAITALGGEDDITVPPPDLALWKNETTGAFSLRLFPGDHFFLHAARDSVVRSVAADLLCAIGETPALGR